MAFVTWADVVTLLPAPELAEVSLVTQGEILAYVHETLNVSRLGGEDSARLRRARMLLAAHMASTGGSGGDVIAGPVISETTGGISRTYAQVVSGDGYEGTTYGQELARLIRTSAARIPFLVI